MPRPPQSANPHTPNYLQVRLPGWLKNEVIAHCERLGCSMNAWLVESIQTALRDGRGLPEPPQARAPIPTPADEIRAYALGERLTTPCGRYDTCDGMDPAKVWDHDGMSFCSTCSIRVG